MSSHKDPSAAGGCTWTERALSGPLEPHECSSCGRMYTEGPVDGAYSTVWGSGPDDIRTTEFYLCPGCALQLVFEIGRGLPAAHFDVMAEVVEHETARRRERAGVVTL